VTVSLLSPAFQLGIRSAVVAALVAVAVVGRPRRSALLRAALATGFALGASAVYLHWDDPFHAGFPGSFYAWAAAPVLGLTLTAAAWRTWGAAARVVGLVSVPISLVFAGGTINAHYAYFPTVRAALGRSARDEVSRTEIHKVAVRTRHGGSLPTHGLVFSLLTPGTASGFRARGTFVYLPPTWFASPHPTLPAVMLLAGSPGTPADWTRSARADVVADAFARTHGGVAPILVMPDANGSPFADTECVDGPRGRAETYLVDDVRPFVIAHYHAASDAGGWAVGGLSEGGTCALTLALRHPDAFGTFVDLGGSDAPDPGGSSARSLYGPSPSVWASYQADRMLARRRYPSLAAWFEVGVGDHGPRRAADELARRAADDAVPACLVERDGQHNFVFWHDSFEHVLPWLASRLGLTPPAGDACAAAGGHWARPGPVGPERHRGAARPGRPRTVRHAA
jgi:S-formylglutathione hydrolase FrmB